MTPLIRLNVGGKILGFVSSTFISLYHNESIIIPDYNEQIGTEYYRELA